MSDVNAVEVVGGYVLAEDASGVRVVVAGIQGPAGALTSGTERSTNPSAPSEGTFIIWMTDGTALGDDGDLMWAVTAGGVTRYGTLADFSSGSVWP